MIAIRWPIVVDFCVVWSLVSFLIGNHTTSSFYIESLQTNIDKYVSVSWVIELLSYLRMPCGSVPSHLDHWWCEYQKASRRAISLYREMVHVYNNERKKYEEKDIYIHHVPNRDASFGTAVLQT